MRRLKDRSGSVTTWHIPRLFILEKYVIFTIPSQSRPTVLKSSGHKNIAPMKMLKLVETHNIY